VAGAVREAWFDGLHDEPRPGKPRLIGDEEVERVIVKTLEAQPSNATHWSTRSMAQATGMSQTAVSRIWRAFGLKPHRTEAFKLSPDPQFIDKVRDIVGLYLNPPDAAVVLCVDEKSQIQALDRSAPILPLMPGVPERRTHDYVRNQTTNLYAALDLASGQVITDMSPRHRAEEFRRFLNLIERSVPAHLDVHVVLDNSKTHKTPSIQRWLVRHPRFTLHFTPTYSSWLNLVERWFAELTTKWIKRSAHRSIRDLVASIRTWITNYRCGDTSAKRCQRRAAVKADRVEEIVLDALRAYSATADAHGPGSRKQQIREADDAIERANADLDDTIRQLGELGLLGRPASQQSLEKLTDALDAAHTARVRLGDGSESKLIGPDEIDKLREPAKRLAAWRRLITDTVRSVTVAPAVTADGRPSRLWDPRRIDIRFLGQHP
jgi:transposase